MVSGPVILTINENSWIFIIFGGEQTKQGGEQMKKKTEKLDDIGQCLVSGALNDTKTIRKASADIFANSGLEQPEQKRGKSNYSPDFS